jgi:hypothetical protein
MTPCAAPTCTANPNTTKATRRFIQRASKLRDSHAHQHNRCEREIFATDQLHASAIQTPAAVPLAPLTLKSTKFPAATLTFPDTVHPTPGAAEQTSGVSAILPGVPWRSVTLIVFDWRENTLNSEAVHPAGTHVRTESASLAAEFALLAE